MMQQPASRGSFSARTDPERLQLVCIRDGRTWNPLQIRGNLVREGGFEPPRPCGHWHLKPARLPFRHSRGSQLVRTSRERLARPNIGLRASGIARRRTEEK